MESLKVIKIVCSSSKSHLDLLISLNSKLSSSEYAYYTSDVFWLNHLGFITDEQAEDYRKSLRLLLESSFE